MSKQEQYNYFERSMTNITPDNEQINNIEIIRKEYKLLLKNIIDNCPQGRELSLALTNLENSLMYAVKSIVLDISNTNITGMETNDLLDMLSTKLWEKSTAKELYICSVENEDKSNIEYHLNYDTGVLYIHKLKNNQLSHETINLNRCDVTMILNKTFIRS